LQDKVDFKELEFHFTLIETMWVDIFTKSLPKPKHVFCFETLGLASTLLQLKGA
jgi:hypothetical protein